MSRWSVPGGCLTTASTLLLAAAVWTASGLQQVPPAKAPAKAEAQAPPETQLPPEEDASEKPQENYSFNPVKSKKDVEVGNLYFKKGSYKAAAGRFTEATKWNDGNAEAWLRLGDAEEKRENVKAARAAWERYIQLAPDAKNAAEVKKKIEKLK